MRTEPHLLCAVVVGFGAAVVVAFYLAIGIRGFLS